MPSVVPRSFITGCHKCLLLEDGHAFRPREPQHCALQLAENAHAAAILCATCPTRSGAPHTPAQAPPPQLESGNEDWWAETSAPAAEPAAPPVVDDWWSDVPAAEPAPAEAADPRDDPWWQSAEALGYGDLLPTEDTPEAGDARPPLRSLLPPEAPDGPSLFGVSRIRSFRICPRRGFYDVIVGLNRPPAPESPRGYLSPLSLGSLVHELLRLRYLGRSWRAVAEGVAEHYRLLAAEAVRLVANHEAWYRKRDDRDWDTRFAELETRYYYPKRRVKALRRKVSLCVSVRHDLGVRMLPPDTGRLPPGVAASEICIVEHKTAAAVTQESITAYRHDAQILQNLLCFNSGVCLVLGAWVPAAAVYGPATHYTVNIIGKAQQHDPEKHLVRTTYPTPQKLVDAYAEDTGNWLYEEFAERAFSDAAREEQTWPKSWSCRDPSTGRVCPHIELCESGGLARVSDVSALRYERGVPFDPQLLVAPLPAKRSRKAIASASAVVPEK